MWATHSQNEENKNTTKWKLNEKHPSLSILILDNRNKREKINMKIKIKQEWKKNWEKEEPSKNIDNR